MERRVRLQGIILREDRVLMTRVQENGQEWYCLPGGGWEPGETFEQGLLRELREECNVQGRIIRQTAHMVFAPGDEAVTYLVDIQKQEPVLGIDPEFEAAGKAQAMIGLHWLPLHEIPERDRAFLWAAGLLGAGDFWSIVESWGDALSYPSVEVGVFR